MPEAAATQLTPAGWLFLIFAWSAIIVLTTFCYVRLMKSGK